MKKPEQKNFQTILSEKAAEAKDLHLLVDNFISETVNYMGATSGSIMVFNKEENCLRLYVSSDHPGMAKKQPKGPIANISIDDSISGKVFKSGKPIIVSQSDKASSKAKLSRVKDQGSFMSLPLKINQKIIGVLNLNRSSKQKAFTKDDLQKLAGVDTLIAAQIDKEALLGNIEENRREIAALFEMSSMLSESNDFTGRIVEFLKKLSNELGMKRSAVIRLVSQLVPKQERKSSIEIIAAHKLKQSQIENMFESVSQRIQMKISSKISQSSNKDERIPLTLLFEEENEISELYCIPLTVEGESCFLIVSRQSANTDEIQAKKRYRFMQIISHNLSMAITREKMLKKAREANEALRKNAEMNKIFFDISKDLGSTLDPYTILQKAFNQFNKVISFTTISVLLFDELESSYNLIVQPAEPISLKCQKALSNSIFDLFSEYPAEPQLTKENFNQPTFFQPQTSATKTVSSLKQFLYLPIILGNGVQGLIHLARKENKPFTSLELDITSQFTGIFITSIKNALIHKRTEKLAFTDPLTELFNHRYFQETLQHEFVRTNRYQKPLSLMIIDIDFFKKFNDTYGHLVGDKVLKHVAKIFKSSIREQIDTVARYGGEEFAVILPETSIEGAAKFAERIRSKVEESRIPEGDKLLSVTLSIGVACTLVTNCPKTSDLIESADQALYKAKASGRNQVQTFNEPTVDNEKTH